jgi:hypothetical protein
MDELKKLLGGRFDDATIAHVLAAADLDGDGEISLSEFKYALLGTGAIAAPAPVTKTVRRSSWVCAKPVWAVVWVDGAWRLKEVPATAPHDDDHC